VRKTVFVIFLLAVVLPGLAVAGSFGPKHDQMVKHFQGDQEPTAKDAVWTAKDIFKVGVFDDGSPRDGYAQYVCLVLNEEGFKGQKVWVQIIDIAKLNRTGSWVKLGEAHCQ